MSKTNKLLFAIVTKDKDGNYVVMNNGKTYNDVWDAARDAKDMNNVTSTAKYHVIKFNVLE